MRWFWVILACLVLMPIEVGALGVFRPLGGGPDVALLFVIFLSLYGPMDDAPISGWLIGIAKDSLSTGPFGCYAVLYLVAAFILSRIRSDIFLESFKAHAANAGVSTLLVYLAVCGWRWTQGADLARMLPMAFGVAAWNAAFAPLAFGIFFRASKRLGASRRPVDV